MTAGNPNPRHERRIRAGVLALATIGAVAGGLGTWTATVGSVASPVAGTTAVSEEESQLSGTRISYTINGTTRGAVVIVPGQSAYKIRYSDVNTTVTYDSVDGYPNGWSYGYKDATEPGVKYIVFTAPSGKTYTYSLELEYEPASGSYGAEDLKDLDIIVNGHTLSKPSEFDPSQTGKTWGIKKYATGSNGNMAANLGFSNIPEGWTHSTGNPDASTTVLTLTSPDALFVASYTFTLKADSGLYEGGNDNSNTNTGQTLTNTIEDLKGLQVYIQEGDNGQRIPLDTFDYKGTGPFEYKGTGDNTHVVIANRPSAYSSTQQEDKTNGTITYTLTNTKAPAGQQPFTHTYTFKLVKEGNNENTGVPTPSYTIDDFKGMKVKVDDVEQTDFDPVNKFTYPDFYNYGQQITVSLPPLANTYWVLKETTPEQKQQEIDEGYQSISYVPKESLDENGHVPGNVASMIVTYRFYFRKNSGIIDPESPDQIKNMKVALNGKEMTDFDPLGKTDYTWTGQKGANAITITNKGTWNVEASAPVQGAGKVTITATSPSGKVKKTYTINIVLDNVANGNDSNQNGNSGSNANSNSGSNENSSNNNNDAGNNQNQTTQDDLSFIGKIPIVIDGKQVGTFDPDKTEYEYPGSSFSTGEFSVPNGWNMSKGQVKNVITLTFTSPNGSKYAYTVTLKTPGSGNTNTGNANTNQSGGNGNTGSNSNGNTNQGGTTHDAKTELKGVVIMLNGKAMPFDPAVHKYTWTGSKSGKNSLKVGTAPWGVNVREPQNGDRTFVVTFTSFDGKATATYTFVINDPASDGQGNGNGGGIPTTPTNPSTPGGTTGSNQQQGGGSGSQGGTTGNDDQASGNGSGVTATVNPDGTTDLTVTSGGNGGTTGTQRQATASDSLAQTGDPLMEASIIGVVTGAASTVAVIALRRRRA